MKIIQMIVVISILGLSIQPFIFLELITLAILCLHNTADKDYSDTSTHTITPVKVTSYLSSSV